MKYDLKHIKSAFLSCLNFLPMDADDLWDRFLYRLEEKSKDDRYTCPKCNAKTMNMKEHNRNAHE